MGALCPPVLFPLSSSILPLLAASRPVLHDASGCDEVRCGWEAATESIDAVQDCMKGVIARMMCDTGALSCIFNAAGIDLNWLYLLMGLLIGPAVAPVSFCLTW